LIRSFGILLRLPIYSVYEVRSGGVIQWNILSDGDGTHNKGYKSEWAAVKGDTLYVGSLGKEWTHSKTAASEYCMPNLLQTTPTPIFGWQEVLNINPQWVKVISKAGEVTSVDWSSYYNRLRALTGTSSPG
jgi:soluble calcium-activated nucleotidase 1